MIKEIKQAIHFLFAKRQFKKVVRIVIDLEEFEPSLRFLDAAGKTVYIDLSAWREEECFKKEIASMTPTEYLIAAPTSEMKGKQMFGFRDVGLSVILSLAGKYNELLNFAKNTKSVEDLKIEGVPNIGTVYKMFTGFSHNGTEFNIVRSEMQYVKKNFFVIAESYGHLPKVLGSYVDYNSALRFLRELKYEAEKDVERHKD